MLKVTWKKIFTTLILFLLLLFICQTGSNYILAEETSTSDSPQTQELQKRIEELQGKINDLQGQERTLSSQIEVMDSQIELTQARIDSTKQQILELTANIDTTNKKIDNLQQSLDDLMEVLIKRIIATYEVGSASSFQVLLSSTSVTNLFTKLNYLKIAQTHDKQLIYSTQQAKVDYANQKDIFEDKKKQVENLKKQLEDYNVQLDIQKTEKQQLLTETQGSEENYQSLLAQAKAQLAGFSSFAQNQGGASLLSNQTFCDDWGCYYNQRDSQWGGLSLDGTNYTIASDGCLVTSMAMVMTHYGRKDVTPVVINSDRNNFSSYNAAYLKYDLSTPHAVRTWKSGYYNSSIIDSELSQGRPVIVGIRYSNGDTHFMVFVSGSNGDYTINDPFVPGGRNVKFTDHYPLDVIYEIDYVSP